MHYEKGFHTIGVLGLKQKKFLTERTKKQFELQKEEQVND